MGSFFESLSPSLRQARTPLSVGAIVVVSLWILFSDSIPDELPETGFLFQASKVIEYLGLTAIVPASILMIGVVGSLSTQIMDEFIHPNVRSMLASIRSRVSFEAYGLTQEQQILTWITGETWRKMHNHTGRDWDKDEVYYILARSAEFQKLSRELRSSVGSDPISPFRGNEYESLGIKLDAQQAEISYRVSVYLPLVLLAACTTVSINYIFWPSILVTSLLYLLALRSMNRIPRQSLNWILHGRGDSTEMSNLRHWVDTYGLPYVSNFHQ